MAWNPGDCSDGFLKAAIGSKGLKLHGPDVGLILNSFEKSFVWLDAALRSNIHINGGKSWQHIAR